uniref:Secreted protein n=1 Tax=Riptortus pedestris TaxID=329032 RepID=R4WMS5_RIPPE|nr:unknown secreted protein [Riptortus pedestris]
MWRYIGYLAVVCLSARAEYPITENINDVLDEAFKYDNKVITELGDGQIPFDATILYGAELSQGTLIGCNSIKRTGDCFRTTFENGTYVTELREGLELAIATFNRVIQGDRVSTATLISSTNSLHWSVVIDPDSCVTRVPVFEIEVLEGTVHQFPRSKASPFSNIKEEINKQLIPFKTQLEKFIYDMCRKKTSHIDLASPFMRRLSTYMPLLLS